MPEYFATKYDSATHEVIAHLVDEIEGFGRRDDSTGDVNAPTGWFALVTVPDEYDVTVDTDEPVAELVTEYGVTAGDVRGSFIVTHNSQGFVSVETFDDEATARAEYDCRAARYAEWDDEDRDEDGDGVYVCPVAGHGYHTL